MNTYTNSIFSCLLLALPLSGLRAQGGDPMREIQQIAESVDEQLREIDELLLESGKKNQAREKPKELLEQASERSATAQDGIDKLIEKLTEMKNQGGGGGGGQQSGEQKPQDGQQSGQPRPGQGQGNRRENQTPDFVQQPRDGQQPGQEGQQQGENQPGQQNQPQPGGQPKGGQETKTGGENQPGNPQDSETGPGQPGTGEGEWGELQPYLNFLRNRGASPKVPPKFRKYYEAYLKNKQKGDK